MKSTSQKNHCHQRSQSGFTLLELIVVVAIVALLGAASIPFYLKTIDRTERITVQVSANRFASTVGLLRSEWIIQNSIRHTSNQKNRVELEDHFVLFNELGWPFSAIAKSSMSKIVENSVLLFSSNQNDYSQEDTNNGERGDSRDASIWKGIGEVNCKKLWDSLIQSGTAENNKSNLKKNISDSIEVTEKLEKINNAFHPTLVGSETCRYQLITKRNSNYFFDFNLMDGRIISSVELLD